MPDFRGVLCDGTVGGELGTAGNVQQALAAKVQPVCIIGIGFQLGVDIGCVVQQDEVKYLAIQDFFEEPFLTP